MVAWCVGDRGRIRKSSFVRPPAPAVPKRIASIPTACASREDFDGRNEPSIGGLPQHSERRLGVSGRIADASRIAAIRAAFGTGRAPLPHARANGVASSQCCGHGRPKPSACSRYLRKARGPGTTIERAGEIFGQDIGRGLRWRTRRTMTYRAMCRAAACSSRSAPPALQPSRGRRSRPARPWLRITKSTQRKCTRRRQPRLRRRSSRR